MPLKKHLQSEVCVEVISASNENLQYLEYVPFYIDYWLQISRNSEIKFIPRVYLIMDTLPTNLEKYSAYLTLLPAGGMSSAFSSQNIRTLATVDTIHDFVITSDIDMVPLSNKYFIGLATQARENRNSFIVGRDVLSVGQYPICYNIAGPEIWSQVIGHKLAKLSLAERLHELVLQSQSLNEYSGKKGGSGWYFDQQFLYSQVERNIDRDFLIRLQDCQTKHKRVDRNRHKSILPLFMLPLIASGLYADYHLPRLTRVMKLFLKVLIKVVR